MNKLTPVISNSIHKRLSVFLTLGYPSLEMNVQIILELSKIGVDFFEIGFPFSDPIADGPSIQKSSYLSLKNGTKWADLLRLAEKVRYHSNVPLIAMCYANTLMCRGYKQSLEGLSKSGFDGLIVPDMIYDNSQDVSELTASLNMNFIHLIAPTSTLQRIQRLKTISDGFIYCIATIGVTGARDTAVDIDSKIIHFLRHVRKNTTVPLFAGFGISNPEKCRQIKHCVDGVIIGSKIIDIIAASHKLPDIMCNLKHFIASIKKELD